MNPTLLLLRRSIQISSLIGALATAAAAQTTYPLIGVTGDQLLVGGPDPETLFLLGQTNASALHLMALGNGADGETIAYNPDDGLLYHASGVVEGDRYWETVDVAEKAIVSSGQFTGPFVSSSHETLAMVYSPAIERFLVADRNITLFDTTLAGVATAIGSTPVEVKGLAFAGGSLYAASNIDDTLYELDPADGAELSSVSVTLGGNAVTGMNGLSTHPGTGALWGIFRVGNNPGTRHLGTVNLATGVVTSVGVLPRTFAGIAFLPEPSTTSALTAGAGAVVLGALGRRRRERR